jgi:hypothetical protein
MIERHVVEFSEWLAGSGKPPVLRAAEAHRG